MVCIACGGRLGEKRREALALGSKLTFQQCENCASWIQTEGLSEVELRALFDSPKYFGTPGNPGLAYRNYVADEQARRLELGERVRRDLAPYLTGGRKRILEVGCATATLASMLRESGHAVAGLDWSPMIAAAAQKLNGVDVKVADVLEVEYPPSSYDLVIMLGTLSNLRAPGAVLSRIRRWLAPNGVLLMTTVVADAPALRILSPLGCWMFAPSISGFYSTQGLRMLVASSGFQATELRQDYQRPSWAKLFGHGGLKRAAMALDITGFANRPIPLRLPMPGVRFVALRPL